MIWRSNGKTLSSHQRATSGNDSSRSVSPVGAQSTTSDVELAGLVVALELQQREQLVSAGRDRELLGADAVDAAARPAARPATPASPTSCAPSPPGPGPPGPTGDRSTWVGSAPSSASSDLRERVRGVGREHERAQARARAAPGGGRGDGGLADAALARVEDRPGRHAASLRRLTSARTGRAAGDTSSVAREAACAQARKRRAAGARAHRPNEARPYRPRWLRLVNNEPPPAAAHGNRAASPPSGPRQLRVCKQQTLRCSGSSVPASG